MDQTDAGAPDLSDLDLVEDEDVALPPDDADEAQAEADMSLTGPDPDDGPGDLEIVEDTSGVAT
jgi:hypothetical protein